MIFLDFCFANTTLLNKESALCIQSVLTDWGLGSGAVKHDCVFGPNLVLDEITAVSQV